MSKPPEDAVVELPTADGAVCVPLEVVQQPVAGQHLPGEEDRVAPAALHQARLLPLLALILEISIIVCTIILMIVSSKNIIK